MTKGLVLKILGVTVVLGGLAVGPLQLINTGSASDSATPSTPAVTSQDHDMSSMAMPTDQPAAPAPVQDQTSAEQAAPKPPAIGRGALLLGNKDVNFVSVCLYSHSAPDDPIVYPNQPGKSHPHDFFGNASTDASSTYESLQASKDTSCRRAGDTAAYWVPALYDSGKLVKPTLARIYYLPGRKDHTTVKPFPAGLKIVARDNNVVVRWACVGRDDVGAGQSTIPTCPQGTHLVERIRFPDCWDGKNLDSADHTSHMAFALRGSCPASHSVPVPAISMNVHYPSDGGDITLGMPEEPVAPHADFFNAWDQPTLERLVATCIDAGVHCGARPGVA